MCSKGAVVDGWVTRSAVHGKTAVGAVLVCVLVVVLAAAMTAYLDDLTREARETALKMGLVNIRMSVQLYHALNERYPQDVRELVTTGYLLPSGKDSVFVAQYLEAQTLDHDGYPVDPFGHRYRYDPAGGRVLSETKGYEQW